ncbi:hypothetical protein KKG31_05660 [Patescibacteria group bacterium]|nr:hypothetical protein [Patescibacteria group bacterium]MBU1758592.1 hypothetical protein [Patescibacteria group bacterium]
MENTVKTILELEEVQALKPDLSQLRIIPRDVCERIQVIIFQKEKNTLQLLTTNNFPDQLKKILTKLEDKGFRYDLHYTSTEGFEYALTWYDKLEHKEEIAEKAVNRQKQAEGK